MMTMFYKGFEAIVNSYEEGEEILINKFGFYDHDEVFFEEEDWQIK